MSLKKLIYLFGIMGALSAMSGCAMDKPEKEDAQGTAITQEDNGSSMLSSENTEETETSEETETPEETETLEEMADVQVLEKAALLINEKRYPQAIAVLSKIENDSQAAEWLEQLRYLISGDYIETLVEGVAVIDKEGNVIIRNRYMMDEKDQQVTEWKNIIRISYGGGFDALNSEGRIFTTVEYTTVSGRGSEARQNDKLTAFSDIVLMSTYLGGYAVADKTGNLYAHNVNNNFLETALAQEEMKKWTDIVDVAADESILAVLQGDGTVGYVYAYKLPGENPLVPHMGTYIFDDMAEWTDIVDLSIGAVGTIAGLKSDGTVVVSKRYSGSAPGEDYFDAAKWTDIIAISKSAFNLLGLKRDGTVVTTGRVNEEQKKVSEWTDIVAISAGQNFHVGLKSDGTLVVAGESSDGWSLDVSDITGLYVPSVDLPMD